MQNKEWIVVEHDLRYLDSFCSENRKLNDMDLLRIDDLKSAVIGLLGIKLNFDDNEIFKHNMLNQVETSIIYLQENFHSKRSKLERIKTFVMEYLQ